VPISGLGDSIVRRKDEERWEEYRMKKMVLRYYDEFKGA